MPASVETLVVDAGPLIALARIDCIGHLPAPFARVITVPRVRAEVAAGTGCSEAMVIEAAIAAGAVEVEQPPAGGASWGLGPGETDALRLALKLGGGVLLDDRAARRIAASHYSHRCAVDRSSPGVTAGRGSHRARTLACSHPSSPLQ